MKICKDCKYYKGNVIGGNCTHPKACSYDRTMERITGEVKVTSSLCVYQRQDGLIGSLINKTCGRRGRFFEQKQKENENEK